MYFRLEAISGRYYYQGRAAMSGLFNAPPAGVRGTPPTVPRGCTAELFMLRTVTSETICVPAKMLSGW
jgi:hypothetical protein